MKDRHVAYGQTPLVGWARYQIALQALSRVVPEFAREHIDVLAVKGVVLAILLHADSADRPLQDVDLRVRPRDRLRAARVAARNGWPFDYRSLQLGAFGFQVGPMLVEVETSVGPPGLCGLTVEAMFSRSRVRTFEGGVQCREPDIVDHTIVLVVNAFKDKLVLCPPWSLRDLGLIVEHPEFDADAFVARIRDIRLRTVTWITADWMADRWPIWGELRDRIATRAPRARYVAAFQRGLRDQPEGMSTRLLARIGSDAPASQAYALAATVAGTAASWTRRRLAFG